ncbi:hypothetical protein [Glycomyces sp. NPDC021274]|uniref:hypothetical protein n=1 Tax=Glycomyces sp. NPDC021274 TaxID=3155120 RepID=UPI0033F21849
MQSAEIPDWAWAVLDHRFDRSPADLDASFTIGIAAVPDPLDGEFLHEPVDAPRLGTVVRMGEPVSDWGWELIGSWETLRTETHRSVSAARIRRSGRGSRRADARPVAYALELAILFQERPFQLPGETDPARYGSVARALSGLTAAAVSGRPCCAQPVQTGACGHLLQARETVRKFNVWFADQVRTHGWPIAVVDASLTCRLAAERAAAHPDARFRAQCRQLAANLLASGDIDPDHYVILCEASLS